MKFEMLSKIMQTLYNTLEIVPIDETHSREVLLENRFNLIRKNEPDTDTIQKEGNSIKLAI